MYRRLIYTGVLLVVGFMVLVAVLATHMKNGSYTQTAIRQSQTILTAGSAEGTIYDRHFTPLVNRHNAYYAAVSTSPLSLAALYPHVLEMAPIVKGIQTGKPFLCRVDTPVIDSPDVTILTLPEQTAEAPAALHIVGYTAEGNGVTGLEADYDALLRGTSAPATVTYAVDAEGKVLEGELPVVSPAEERKDGIVTTIDRDIQLLCERQEVEKGAIVVMDVKTGDILAMASFPTYDPENLSAALDDPDSPLINRCLYAYSVGSIFKLVTCADAYAEGKTGFLAECTGKTEVRGQVFRCHDWRGHGLLDMKRAMVFSCNTYFIDLSTGLDPVKMRETAQDLGFGTQIALSGSIVSASGTLPSAEDLELPAEMANFCFGQGKLTATPLQVTQMTCGIANDGDMPLARLIAGYTTDGETVDNKKQPMYAKALPRNTAYFLQDMMIAAVNESENSNAVPANVFAAAKTSTAQTGRYNEEEIELCHAWITGYFPIDAPKYAVTVLVEDGGYGNDAAAPVFRTIAEEMTKMGK